ncbi:hypothetical protein Tco_0979556 [Tanacetum coccineum]
MDDLNITMEEYIKLEEEKAHRHGRVFNWQTATYEKIRVDDDLHDLRSVEAKFPAIVINDTFTPQDALPYVDDLDFFKDFENEFPAIVYNDAQMPKSDYLTKQILSPQHNNESDLNNEISLSEYDEVGQNVLYFNDLFPFNVIHLDDLKLDEDNDINEIDIIQSSGDNLNTYRSNMLLETRMLLGFIMNLYVPFGIPFDPKRYYKDGDCTLMLRRPRTEGLSFYNLCAILVDFADMAPLLPREQRHPFLRVQVVDFQGMPELIRDGLFARIVMEHRDDVGVVVFTILSYVEARGTFELEAVYSGLRITYQEEMESLGFARYWSEGWMLDRSTSLLISLISEEAWVAIGTERHPDVATGAPRVAQDAPIVDEGGQADPTPTQAPPLLPADARTMSQRMDQIRGGSVEIVGRHLELTSPEQTAFALAIPGQTATGKESSNPLMADSLPKTIQSNDPPLSRGYTLRSREDSLKLMELMAYCTNLCEFVNKKNREINTAGLKETAALCTMEDGVQAISATIDRKVKVLVSEASFRRHLKLEDSEGISSLPNAEIFEQLANMGYVTDSDNLTFQKGHFSPQWKFFIHTILHYLSPKKTAWDQFSSNIATAIICLATNRIFNFFKFLFEAMVKNIDSQHKFLMYPRFIQIFVNKHQRLLLPHKTIYPTPTLKHKLFNNMKRVSKGYSRVVTPLFDTMIAQGQSQSSTPQTSPSRITSSPSLSPQTHQPSPSPHQIDTTHHTEEPTQMPHESPIHSVHSLGRDEDSLSLNELTILLVVSSASSAVTYTSVYTDFEPDRALWGADDEEDPRTPLVPQDEDEREPMFIQTHDPEYMPEPIYPKYIPLEDEHEFPTEEQPLPPVDSPTAESPGYITESDPEEDPEEYEDDETEDGPVDYPMDGGDDDNSDSSRDDANDEDEDEDEEEEEEHLAPADFAVVVLVDEHVSPPEGIELVIPPPSTNITIGARIFVRPQTSISLPPEAEVERLLAMTTPSPSPLLTISPNVEVSFFKLLCITDDIEDMTFSVYALPCYGLVLFVMALFIHAL